MSVDQKPRYDSLVLSGGGAKGAYGAGAAKALAVYRAKKEICNPICFVGASAGALNAAILASFPPDQFLEAADELLKFWREASNRKVLGILIPWQKYQFCKANVLNNVPLIGRQPFSVYSNAALRRLVESKVKRLKAVVAAQNNAEHHLIVAVTDYTEGSLKAFYHSHTFRQCVDYDRSRNDSRKPPRLLHCCEITANNLVDVLLASAAIPVFFPPVKIDENYYIDGGVGNNTPTREAAYFFRYLQERELGVAGDAFCMLLDDPRHREDEPDSGRLLGIVLRTLNIYHYVHMKPIVKGWGRINKEVEEHHGRVTELVRWAREEQGWDHHMVTALEQQIKKSLWNLGGATARVSVPLHVVEPSTSLGDTLSFSPSGIKRNIEAGYVDMLNVLYPPAERNHEYEELRNAPI